MHFDEDQLLQLLPERLSLGPVPIEDVDFSRTAVERYVRDVVERQPPLEAQRSELATIMSTLLAQGVQPPVQLDDLRSALSTPANREMRAQLLRQCPDFYARALRTLNGPDFKLVPSATLAEAARKEEAMSLREKGWGVSEPPVYATAFRLLASSGLPTALLPPYRTLHLAQRGCLMAAWEQACEDNDWKACNPAGDVHARARSRRAA